MEYDKDKARYSRADLLSLRYEASAKQPPNCVNILELQTLSFWKINGLAALSNVNSNSSNNTCCVNKSGLSPDRDLTSSNNLLSSRRALRNRERAHNYYQRFTSSEQQQIEDNQARPHSPLGLIPANLSNTSSYKTSSPNIDQRSISSSHLMPAFAKRRFVTATETATINESQQAKVNASLVSTFTDRTVNLKDANVDTKTHLRRPNNSLTLGSPVRSHTLEWERSAKQSNNSQRDHDKTLMLSPTLPTSRQQGGGLHTPQERRIGSGRLLPRNDNWEYKNQETEASKMNMDNDRAANNGSNSNQHRVFGGKLNERSNDNLADRDSRRREDGKKNTITGRRVFNKDKFNIMELTSQSMNRGKRSTNNLYHQSHDAHEPEWFSAGPTSQHETIDLHGFEELIESEKRPAADLALKEPNEKLIKHINMETVAAPSFISRSSSIVSLNQIESNNGKKDSNETTSILNDIQSKHHNSISKSDVEFNFDAFLNMDPLDNTLMSKEGEVHGQVTGTSRFCRWFSPNEPASNNEVITITDASTLETQEIPSVKDLEAQMTKVNLRSEYLNETPMTNTLKTIYTTDQIVEKPLPRDTEAFKRLLQQLGSQNIAHSVAEPSPYLINVATVRDGVGPITNIDDRYKHIVKKKIDERQSFEHQRVKNDSNLTHRQNNDTMPLSQQTPIMTSIDDPIQFGSGHDSLPLQNQKRFDIQHLLQSVIRGDVSFEFLEKELNNPNTTAQSKELIATVLFEYTNSGRFVGQPKPPTFHNDSNHTNVVKNYSVFNRNLGTNVSEGQVINQHPLRHSNSPTPLAFTPTSVLRKMTADKETTSLYTNTNMFINQQQQYHQNYHQLSTSIAKLTNVHNMMNDSSVISAGINLQPRMILGGNYAMQNQLNMNNTQISPKILPQQMTQSRSQLTSKWPPGNPQLSHTPKSYGRPILKGTLNSALAISPNNDIQQHVNQQRLKCIQQTEAINTENSGPSLIQNVYNDGISQRMQHQHYLQHQQQQQSRLRLIHGDIHCPTNLPISSSTSKIGGHDGGIDGKILIKKQLSPLNYQDRLSPTTNQLAQWFSPELLARASAGKLPLLNMNEAVSLEEFERNIQHSSATVLN